MSWLRESKQQVVRRGAVRCSAGVRLCCQAPEPCQSLVCRMAIEHNRAWPAFRPVKPTVLAQGGLPDARRCVTSRAGRQITRARSFPDAGKQATHGCNKRETGSRHNRAASIPQMTYSPFQVEIAREACCCLLPDCFNPAAAFNLRLASPLADC